MSSFDSVQLLDGRRLEFRVTGAADGLPVVFHHGTPGAGTAIAVLERAVASRGMRLVTPTRPGYGGSDRDPGRSVADVVADTEAILDAIGAPRCVVAGWSGGGPHALACVARLDAAVAALVIAGVGPADGAGLDFLAGMGEDNVVEFGAAIIGEAALRPLLDAYREHLRDVTAEGIIASLESLLPDVDRAVLTDEFGDDMAASFHEGLRTGVDGWLDDDLAFVKPWGFDFAEIDVPVMMWQGTEDLMVPFAHGEWLADRIPGVVAHLETGEGHLSVGIGAMDAMFDELAAVVASF